MWSNGGLREVAHLPAVSLQSSAEVDLRRGEEVRREEAAGLQIGLAPDHAGAFREGEGGPPLGRRVALSARAQPPVEGAELGLPDDVPVRVDVADEAAGDAEA